MRLGFFLLFLGTTAVLAYIVHSHSPYFFGCAIAAAALYRTTPGVLKVGGVTKRKKFRVQFFLLPIPVLSGNFQRNFPPRPRPSLAWGLLVQFRLEEEKPSSLSLPLPSSARADRGGGQ